MDPIDRPLSDSGKRTQAETGYLKEPDGERKDFTWVFELEGFELVPREMIERMAAHMAKGAKKYEPENWRLATTPGALAQLRRSLSRHIFQWFRDETDEDHAAAVTFNMWAYEINHARQVPNFPGFGPAKPITNYLAAQDPSMHITDLR